MFSIDGSANADANCGVRHCVGLWDGYRMAMDTNQDAGELAFVEGASAMGVQPTLTFGGVHLQIPKLGQIRTTTQGAFRAMALDQSAFRLAWDIPIGTTREFICAKAMALERDALRTDATLWRNGMKGSRRIARYSHSVWAYRWRPDWRSWCCHRRRMPCLDS